jgi:hypothetical protein
MQLLKDLMSRDVKVVSPDMTIEEAARKMREGDFAMMPAGEGDRMIGTKGWWWEDMEAPAAGPGEPTPSTDGRTRVEIHRGRSRRMQIPASISGLPDGKNASYYRRANPAQAGARAHRRRRRHVERSHAEYREGRSLLEMIEEDLVAERIAIDSYRDFIQYLGAKDSTTRRMLETILAAEEEHADELADLLQSRIPGDQ